MTRRPRSSEQRRRVGRCGPIDPPRWRWLIGLGLAFAAAAQILVLATPEYRASAVLVALGLGLVVDRAWSRGCSMTLRMLLVTATLCGAAMLAGSLIDLDRTMSAPESDRPVASPESLPPCHAAALAADPENRSDPSVRRSIDPTSESWSERIRRELCSWMTGLMLLVCVPGCALLCPPCRAHRRRRRWLVLHGACAATMLVGMFVGGRWLSPMVARVGLGPLSAAHLSMLIGMLAGTALGSSVVDLAARRRARPLEFPASGP